MDDYQIECYMLNLENVGLTLAFLNKANVAYISVASCLRVTPLHHSLTKIVTAVAPWLIFDVSAD